MESAIRAKIITPDGQETIIEANEAEVCRLAREPGYTVHILAPATFSTFPPVDLGPRDGAGWRQVKMDPPGYRRANWFYNDVTAPKAKA